MKFQAWQGELAQMVERSIRIREAPGSMPGFSTGIFCRLDNGSKNRFLESMPPISGSFGAQGELAQMVERSLSMREVRGSMPRFSTIGFRQKHHFKKNRNMDRRVFLRIYAFALRNCASQCAISQLVYDFGKTFVRSGIRTHAHIRGPEYSC